MRLPDRRTQANSLLSLNHAEKQFYFFCHYFIGSFRSEEDSPLEFVRRNGTFLDAGGGRDRRYLQFPVCAR